ncbi:unnamed protein product [Strongylus vulgaris]|uniref:CUB domain-containing protein n=1 Tax=Strongylus vulgaris TaxID=40348 RepID=A0A3P7JM02_STRVU|nr:unnamed protein product [Strongylus vulgaris]
MGCLVATTTPTVTIAPSPSNPPKCNTETPYIAVPANITSPNYPNNFPPYARCFYTLTTDTSHRINLTFGAIDTNKEDTIAVLDYHTDNVYYFLDIFSGQFPAGNKSFTSTWYRMLVEFFSEGGAGRKGFSAVAVPIA